MKNIFLVLLNLCSSCLSYPLTNKGISMKKKENLLNSSDQIQTTVLTKLQSLYSENISLENLQQLDLLLNEIDELHSIALFFKYVHDDTTQKNLASKVYEDTKIFLINEVYNKNLYTYINKYTSLETENENKQFINSLILDLKRNGLHKENFLKISKKAIEIEQIKTKMSEQLLVANSTTIKLEPNETEGLPAHMLEKNTKSGLSISIASDLQGVFKFAKQSPVRKKFYLAANKRGQINEKDFKAYLQLSQEYASMLGFENFTEYALSDRMVQNKQNFFKLQKQIEIPLKEQFKKDLELLKNEFTITNLQPWDISYYSSLYSKKYFNIDPLEIRQYFEIDFVLNKLLEIYTSTFQIKFTKTLLDHSNSWTEDPIYKIDFYDDQKTLGTLFLDLFPRPEKQKYGHFAQFTLAKRTKNTLASCAIVGNFQRKTDAEPSLLSYYEINTLAHELGHAFHTLTSNVEYHYLSGTSVKHDFVEVPSQLFEKWLDDAKIFQSLSKHYKTQEKISLEKIAQLKHSSEFLKSLKHLNQLKMSEADLRLFSGESMENPQKLYHSLLSTVLPLPENLFTLYSFEHLFGGYEAGYYGYLWSEVIVEDLNSRFKTNYLDPKVGQAFKEKILSKGASKEPNELLNDFLGRPFNSDAFIKFIHN